MRAQGRPLLIGFILVLVLWLSTVVALGIGLARAEPVGTVEYGIGPVVLAAGEVDGPRRRAGMEAAGFVVILAVGALPLAVSLARARAGRATSEVEER